MKLIAKLKSTNPLSHLQGSVKVFEHSMTQACVEVEGDNYSGEFYVSWSQLENFANTLLENTGSINYGG